MSLSTAAASTEQKTAPEVEGLRCEIRDRVAWVTLDRPDKLNSLTHEMMDRLPGLLRELAEDSSVGCLVLTGAGKGFCAGGDIQTAVEPGDLTRDELVARFERRGEASRLLHEMPKPTIAAINGVAAGAGLSLALACDLRLSSDRARFGTAFIRVAFSGDYGATYFLQRLVGPAIARELMFTADVIDSERAERMGLVNRVVPVAELAAQTHELAARIASGPPLALARMKQGLNAAATESLADVLAYESGSTVAMMETADNKEALQAFFGKRAPVFTGE